MMVAQLKMSIVINLIRKFLFTGIFNWDREKKVRIRIKFNTFFAAMPKDLL